MLLSRALNSEKERGDGFGKGLLLFPGLADRPAGALRKLDSSTPSATVS